MRKFIAIITIALVATFVFASVASASVYVKGYYKSNGTYVSPHYRSNPDGNSYNNYSSYGNINPYTGSVGTKMPSYYYTPSYSGYSSYSSPYYGSYGGGYYGNYYSGYSGYGNYH